MHGDAALLHIEQGAFIELAYRSAMTALHIIGINLQLRLGIHMRFASGAKITVRLLGTRMLCTRTYQYQACKSTDRLVVEHILKEFVAGTVGHCMVYGGIVVHMLVLIRNSHPAKVQFSTFAGKRNFGCIAGSTVMQSHSVQQNVAVSFLSDIQTADAYRTGMRLFQFIEVESGVLPNEYLYHLRSKEIHTVHGVVACQKTGLRTLFQNDKHTAVYHKVDIAAQNVHQLDRFLHHHVLGNIQQYAVLRKGCIESRHSIFGSICQLTVVLLHQLRTLFRHFLEATEDNALRQMRLRQSLVIESIIHNKVKGGAHIRHIALEYFVGINRNLQPVQVQSVIGFKELADIGIFIFLRLTGRKAKPLEVGKCSGTRSIQRFGAMAAYHRLRLGEKVYILLLYTHVI